MAIARNDVGLLDMPGAYLEIRPTIFPRLKWVRSFHFFCRKFAFSALKLNKASDWRIFDDNTRGVINIQVSYIGAGPSNHHRFGIEIVRGGKAVDYCPVADPVRN